MVMTDKTLGSCEGMCLTPSTPRTASSTVLVTWDSSSAGAAPNCDTATEITEVSAEGSRVTASLVKDTQPRIRRMMENTTDGSGLRIDHAQILRAISVPACDRVYQRTWS